MIYDVMIYDMVWYVMIYDIIWYIWYIELQLGSHPVAVVQYTFTHKQYTERHKTNNTQNKINILEECEPCPVLAGFALAFALQLRKNMEKPQSG